MGRHGVDTQSGPARGAERRSEERGGGLDGLVRVAAPAGVGGGRGRVRPAAGVASRWPKQVICSGMA